MPRCASADWLDACVPGSSNIFQRFPLLHQLLSHHHYKFERPVPPIAMPTPKLQQASVSTALRTICDAPLDVLRACGDLTEANAKIIQALLPTPRKENGATETARLIANHAEGAVNRGLLESPGFHELQKEIEETLHEFKTWQGSLHDETTLQECRLEHYLADKKGRGDDMPRNRGLIIRRIVRLEAVFRNHSMGLGVAENSFRKLKRHSSRPEVLQKLYKLIVDIVRNDASTGKRRRKRRIQKREPKTKATPEPEVQQPPAGSPAFQPILQVTDDTFDYSFASADTDWYNVMQNELSWETDLMGDQDMYANTMADTFPPLTITDTESFIANNSNPVNMMGLPSISTVGESMVPTTTIRYAN
jgi:hypothetical protein